MRARRWRPREPRLTVVPTPAPDDGGPFASIAPFAPTAISSMMGDVVNEALFVFGPCCFTRMVPPNAPAASPAITTKASALELKSNKRRTERTLCVNLEILLVGIGTTGCAFAHASTSKRGAAKSGSHCWGCTALLLLSVNCPGSDGTYEVVQDTKPVHLVPKQERLHTFSFSSKQEILHKLAMKPERALLGRA